MGTRDNLNEQEMYIKEVVSQDKLESIQNKIRTIIKSSRELGLGNVKDIFISDFKDDNGRRVYDDLWLFFDNYWLEARGFETKYDYTIIPLDSAWVSHINIKKKEYDLKKAQDASIMSLYVYLNIDLLLTLKATEKNCDYLKNITLKYFMKHFKPK